jgi:hypothetical protein
MDFYRFVVGDAKDIDIPRICREAEEDGRDAVLVTSANCLLLIKQSVLDQFTTADGFSVGGTSLYNMWGNVCVGVRQVGPEVVQFESGRIDGYYPKGWRCKTFSKEGADIAVKALKAARKYQRRIAILVHDVSKVAPDPIPAAVPEPQMKHEARVVDFNRCYNWILFNATPAIAKDMEKFGEFVSKSHGIRNQYCIYPDARFDFQEVIDYINSL